MPSYLSIYVLRVPSKINDDWFNPNTSLVKRMIWIALLVRFSTWWSLKNSLSLSFSLIQIWRKTFSMSAQKITESCYNQNVSQFILKRWPPFQTMIKRIHRLWRGQASYTTLSFVDASFCLITGLWGRKNSFRFSLWFSETFSITLSTKSSLITWSYALNNSRFCLSRLKCDFRWPRLPDLLLFKDTLFSVHTRPALRHSLIFLRLLFELSIHVLIMTWVIIFHS